MSKQIVKGVVLFFMMMCFSVHADAQLSDILNKVVSAVTGQDKVSEKNIVGTWVFTGSGIELTSEGKNILKDLGSIAASQQIEKKLDGYLSKVGITKDKFTITFAEDKTLTVKTAKGKSHSGTYTLSEGKVIIKLGNFGNGITCETDITAKTLKLMVKADKLITLASMLSNMSSSGALKTISALLKNYDGINIGMQFTR